MAKAELNFGELSGGNTLKQLSQKAGGDTVSTDGYSLIYATSLYTGVIVTEIGWIVGVDSGTKTEGWFKLPFSSSAAHSSISVTDNNNGTITISDYNECTVTIYGI